MTERQPYICPGCMVREPWEHRCCRDEEDGRMCECEECAIERSRLAQKRVYD